MTSRRAFLKECSTLVVGAATVPLAAVDSPLSLHEVTLEQIPFGAFASQVNSIFQTVAEAGSSVPLKLIAAPPRRTQGLLLAPDARNEKFSLLFHGPRDQELKSAVHLFEHSPIGRFTMFIMPVGPGDQEHVCYEAVFIRPMFCEPPVSID